MQPKAASRAQPAPRASDRDVVHVRADLQRRIAQLAARQRGVVSHGQLLALGLTRSAIKRWVKQGRLHPIHRGVYLLGHPVAPPLALEQGALLAAGDDSVLTHLTAGRLDGFLEEEDGALIHVTTSRFRGRPPGLVVHTSRRLPPRDITWRHNLPITTPPRTLVDIAEVADARVVERAVETAFAKRRVTEPQLRATIQRLPGRRGGRRLTAFLDSRGSGFTRSWAEDQLRRLARAARLPAFVCNDRVAGYEVDVHFVGRHVIVEVDSWLHHSGQVAFARDRRKWADLRAAGYEVVGVTAWELKHEPEAVVARISGALALASRG